MKLVDDDVTREKRLVRQAEASAFFSFINPTGLPLELRCLWTRGEARRPPYSGLYTDMQMMAHVATALAFCRDPELRPHATYFTLNAVSPEVIPRIGAGEMNRLNFKGRTTSKDADILSRSLYLIDVDPVRPAGTAATATECAHAAELADQIEVYLNAIGFPEPLRLFSGNGTHLLLRGDGCAAIDPAWKYFLHYLDEKFSSELVGVDISVHNASRISRAPGCWNRKGEDTPERPHRLAKVIRYPAEWVALPVATLHEFAAANGFSTRPTRKRSTASLPSEEKSGPGTYDRGELPNVSTDQNGLPRLGVPELEKLISDHSSILKLANVSYYGGAHYFALSECPIAGRAHSNPFPTSRGKTALFLKDGGLFFNCFSSKCSGKRLNDVFQVIANEAQDPRAAKRALWARIYIDSPSHTPVEATQVVQAAAESTEDTVDELLTALYRTGAGMSNADYSARYHNLINHESVPQDYSPPLDLANIARLRAHREWDFDQMTLHTLASAEFAANAPAPSLEDYGVSLHQLRIAFREVTGKSQAWSVANRDAINDTLRRNDTAAMLEFLGREDLYRLHRQAKRGLLFPPLGAPVEPDLSFAEFCEVLEA